MVVGRPGTSELRFGERVRTLDCIYGPLFSRALRNPPKCRRQTQLGRVFTSGATRGRPQGATAYLLLTDSLVHCMLEQSLPWELTNVSAAHEPALRPGHHCDTPRLGVPMAGYAGDSRRSTYTQTPRVRRGTRGAILDIRSRRGNDAVELPPVSGFYSRYQICWRLWVKEERAGELHSSGHCRAKD